MAHELIAFNVSHVSPEVALDSVEAVHPVGASHLKDYMSVIFGDDTPEDPTDRRVTDRFFKAIADFSTDEDLMRVFNKDPLRYIPYWLGAFTPVVDATKSLFKQADIRLSECEGAHPQEPTNNLSFVVGLSDLASFAISMQLEIPHPRFENEKFMEDSLTLPLADRTMYIPPKVGEITAFDLLTLLSSVKADHKRKMINLQTQGQKIVDASQENLIRLQNIMIAHPEISGE